MTSPPAIRPGHYYHIYNRGNNRENIFIVERNYPYFLTLYAKHVEPIAGTYAYCLLQNHFHILVRIKTEEEQGEYPQQTPRVSETRRVSPPFKPRKPGQQFSNLFNAYAKAINKAHKRSGSLFSNPFGRVLVTSDAHFTHLVV